MQILSESKLKRNVFFVSSVSMHLINCIRESRVKNIQIGTVEGTTKNKTLHEFANYHPPNHNILQNWQLFIWCEWCIHSSFRIITNVYQKWKHSSYYLNDKCLFLLLLLLFEKWIIQWLIVIGFWLPFFTNATISFLIPSIKHSRNEFKTIYHLHTLKLDGPPIWLTQNKKFENSVSSDIVGANGAS